MKQIPNFPNYFADKKGNIWSTKGLKLRKLKPSLSTGGYLIVSLYREKKKYIKAVQRLILETFEGPSLVDYWTRHSDNNKENNKYSNLKRVTPKNSGDI
jgi:hypothetical protein